MSIEKLKDLEPISRKYILEGFRKSFRYSSTYKNFLNSQKIYKERFKQDGTPYKKPLTFFKCNHCKKLFKQKEINVDHIDPVIPTNKASKDMTFSEILTRMHLNDLQILCKPCHNKKSSKERTQRSSSKGNLVMLKSKN